MVQEKDFSFLPDNCKPVPPIDDQNSEFYENSKLTYETHVDEAYEYYELQVKLNLKKQRLEEAMKYRDHMVKFKNQGKLRQQDFEAGQVNSLNLDIEDYMREAGSFEQIVKTDQENMEKSLHSTVEQ